MVIGLASMRSISPARSAESSSSMPTSAGPVSRLFFFTYSNSTMSSPGPEDLVEEVAQGARLLGEGDQEVVAEAFVQE